MQEHFNLYLDLAWTPVYTSQDSMQALGGVASGATDSDCVTSATVCATDDAAAAVIIHACCFINARRRKRCMCGQEIS